MSGEVYRHDDPIWLAIYPPNGFNCRCRVVALSAAAVKRRGLRIVNSDGTLSHEMVEIGVDIEIFGVQRAMFASNFPVDGLCTWGIRAGQIHGPCG